MTAQQLKNSILQMAVQGKLVPQDPNDEPASILLERIRKEKEKLIKEGKIKREKNPSVIFRGADNTPYEKVDGEVRCLADEIPFDIPDSWEWARLGAISTYAETKEKINAKYADPNVWGLDLEDIEKGGRAIVKLSVGERKAIGDKTVFEKGSILYSKLRPYLLKVLVAEESGICTPEIVPFKMYGGINHDYIVAFLKSPYVDSAINAATYGIKMPRAGTETMISLFVPVPPLSEQSRIVEKLKELEPFVFDYGEKEGTLNTLNADFPDSLKKSVLQMAVQGKLVPQDTNDEPASVLLERIRTEKERLIKEGKIKRDKNESVVFRRDNSHYEKLDGIERCIDEEIPFEIPDTWAWVRITTVCKSISAGGDKPSKCLKTPTSDCSIPIISNGEKNGGLFGYTNEARINETSITVSARGTIGFSCVRRYPYYPIVRLISIIPTSEVSVDYVQIVLSALLEKGAGTSIQQLTVPMISTKLIPLPPLAEQERIVKKVEELLPLIKRA